MALPLKVNATVKEIIVHGDGVYSVKFDVPSRYTRFKPGQFTHLCLDEFDPTQGYWPESRVFSIASAPRQEELSIVYSVKGAYTQRMAHELVVGGKVWLKLPYGDFTIEETLGESQKIVLIAGGTGISPYIPYLTHAEKKSADRVVKLFYGFRSDALFLFQNELRAANKMMPHLAVNLFIETPQSTYAGDWTVTEGRLSAETILGQVAEPHEYVYFLSGPPQMISALKSGLCAHDIKEQSIKIDDWE